MDLRIPIAVMFVLLGVILAGYGMFAPRDVAPRDLGIQVNLLWGSFMLIFGLLLGSFALFSRRRG
jgi:hypothetical protein